jgi:hypothetical protein
MKELTMTVKEVIAHAKAIRKYCDTYRWCKMCPFYGRMIGCRFLFNTPDDWTFSGIREKKARADDGKVD